MSETVEVTAVHTITKKYDLSEIWEVLTGSDFVGCQDFTPRLECDWEKEWSDIPIWYYLPDKLDKDGYYEKEYKVLTKEMILSGFEKAVQAGATHCSGHRIDDLDDADACFAHQVLQYALYGEINFG